jgi:hypothetical protein
MKTKGRPVSVALTGPAVNKDRQGRRFSATRSAPRQAKPSARQIELAFRFLAPGRLR